MDQTIEPSQKQGEHHQHEHIPKPQGLNGTAPAAPRQLIDNAAADPRTPS
jgi:hypothetical protein